MFLLGQTRYVDLRILNGGTPVTGLQLSDLSIYFSRNASACSDALTLIESDGGRYALKYTPSAAGHDYLEVSYSAAGYLQMNSEDIVSTDMILGGSSAKPINQDTPTTGALKVTAPNPSSYTLYIFQSSDWQTGNTDTYSAVASTQIDASGNWLTSPLYVTSGTYHVIIRDNSGFVQVLKAYLQV